MPKIAKHFTVTKKLPNKASIEFSGIFYKNDPENYDIEDVRFLTHDRQGEIIEDITNWFHSFRALNDPEFHHNDIVELLTDVVNETKTYQVVAIAGTCEQLKKTA